MVQGLCCMKEAMCFALTPFESIPARYLGLETLPRLSLFFQFLSWLYSTLFAVHGKPS